MRHAWEWLRASLWFLPAVLVVCAVALALGLIEIEPHTDWRYRYPRLFGAGAEGARSMVSTIAGSMITVAGVTFSITVVALTLASSQYTSRILRNFMRDRANHAVLGVFLGVYAYCLVVLRTIRGGDEGVFVPAVAVLGSVVLAFVGIGFLIFFIHHVTASLQASSIIARAAEETLEALDRLFPAGVGGGAEENFHTEPAPSSEGLIWAAIPAARTGYIQSVDADALLRFAAARQTVLRMDRGIGEFVTEGVVLAYIAGGGEADADASDELNRAYTVGRHRTIVQDAGYGIRQIVDIALKALSPGINDTTTAVECVDFLGAILVRAGQRRIETRHRLEDGELRVIARGATFEGLLHEAFDQIRQNAPANVAVLTRLLEALKTVGRATSKQRGAAVFEQAKLVAATAERTVPEPRDRQVIVILLDEVREAVAATDILDAVAIDHEH